MRRLLALALALLPVQGSAATLVAGAPSGHAHCTGDVCRCVSHCPPKKTAARPCHEAEAPRGALVQAATCGAQEEAAAPVSTRPQVTPAPFVLGPAFRTFELATSAATGALPGFLQIDLPPPRTA
jgi:heme A synthase